MSTGSAGANARAALIAALLCPAALAAQIPQVAAGSRVRLSTSFGRATGSYAGLVGDSVEFVESAGDRRRFALDRVERVEVSVGTSRRASVHKGLRIGLGAGAALGVIYIASTQLTTPYSTTTKLPLGPEQVRDRVALQVLLGGAIGTLVGATRRVEQWRQVFP